MGVESIKSDPVWEATHAGIRVEFTATNRDPTVKVKIGIKSKHSTDLNSWSRPVDHRVSPVPPVYSSSKSSPLTTHSVTQRDPSITASLILFFFLSLPIQFPP